MGHKKRTVGTRIRKTPAVDSGVSVPANVSPSLNETKQNPNSSTENKQLEKQVEVKKVEVKGPSGKVKLECGKALYALSKGKDRKALRIMKDVCGRNLSCVDLALAYRVQGTIYYKVSMIFDDVGRKNKFVRNARESAKKATLLSPDSIEYAHFYANMMFEASEGTKEYCEVLDECERALEVENPVDPGLECLQEDNQMKMLSSDVRIGFVQNELQDLKNRANFRSISAYVKTLGNGEVHVIQARRVVEDPMDVGFISEKKCNEVKKAIKTHEERRKEIEVQVAAARLLQQKSELALQQDDSDKDLVLDQSSGPGQRIGERKKVINVKKSAYAAGWKDFVQSYWNSMTAEMKINLLMVNEAQIMAYSSLLKDTQADKVLTEAISFARAKRQWKFWACCRCDEKFSDSESHLHHFLQEHTSKLSPEMQSVLPEIVGDVWIHMLLSCAWKPLDAVATVKMLRKQANPVDPNSMYESCGRKDMNEDTGCFADSCSENAWDSSSQEKEMVDRFESKGHDNVSDRSWGECKENSGCKTTFSPGSWPLSNDVECVKLLQKISSVLQLLIKHKCLTESHLSKIIRFSMNELQNLDSGSQLLDYGLDQTPLCICFLRAKELKKVLEFLQEISNSWGVGQYSEKNNFLDDSKSNIHADTTQRVVLDESNSFPLLDENFMPCNAFSSMSYDAVTDDATSNLDADALLSWIYTDSSIKEQWTHWMHTREQKANEGMEILHSYEKKFLHLQTLCDRKIGYLTHEEALQSIEDICIKEGKRRDHQSLVSMLRKRQKELTERENDVMCTGSRYELNVISNILNEAESLHPSQIKLENITGDTGSNIVFMVPDECNKLSLKNFLHQIDSWIVGEIQRQKEQSSNEFKKTEEKLLQSIAEIHNLKIQIEAASAHDYRSILVPLMKSFIRAHLEDLAEKDATEKSDAARDAFLAELALDSKKHTVNGNNGARHDKSKEKKKNKDLRKTRDVKDVSNNELHMHPQEIAESSSVSFESDEGHLDRKPVVGGSGDDRCCKEEELQRRELELEAEVRKLEETLEYQRMIENQGKQKHHAVKHKISDMAILEKNSVLDLADEYITNTDNDKHVSGKLNCWQVLSSQRQSKGFCNGLGHVPGETGNEASHKIGVTHSNHNDPMVKPSLSKGVGENGYGGFKQWTGRRGKREKGLNKVVEGKHQCLQFGQFKLNDRLIKQDDAYMVNGTKTPRQLCAEEDDEERFEADLKRAVCQSLGMENVNGVHVYGTGLQNDAGEYNCFLNVIIQSLWHIRRFRKDFMRKSALGHVHVGDPCVICALNDIFSALSTASSNLRKEAIAPTSLRTALSNLYPESNFFQKAQMNDASEVLGVIFDCIHRSFTSGLGVSDTESIESNCMGSWDCANNACVAHSLFGMNVFERLNCYSCGLESREMKYTSFFYNINASALRTMKAMCPGSGFDELLSLVERSDQFMCSPEVQGCGKFNYKHHILSTRPHVFTAVLGWQNTCESVDDIRATLAALATDIDMGVLYGGLDPKKRHKLISVVCYYGQHYHCFAYGHDHECWIKYDDKTVELIGGWEDVISICEKGHLQPQVLFFEAVN